MKAKGVKTTEERFAYALETEMNTLAADGWEYLRPDTLPAEQREGLMGKTTVYQNMLVFRRAVRAKQPPKPSRPPVVAEKSGQERVANKKRVTAPAPVAAPKPPSADVAAE